MRMRQTGSVGYCGGRSCTLYTATGALILRSAVAPSGWAATPRALHAGRTGSVMTARTPTDLRDDDDKVDFLVAVFFEIDLVVVDANCVETLCANDIVMDIKRES